MKIKRILSLALVLCMLLSSASALAGVSFAATANYKMGDVDNDGTIDAGDARKALRMSVDLEPYTEKDREFIVSDINGDKTVGADEARLILRASVDLEDASKWSVPAYAKVDDEPAVRKMEQPTCKYNEKIVKDYAYLDKNGVKKTETRRFDQYTFTFTAIPKNLEELKQIDISDPKTGGFLTTCLAILIYDAYTPVNGELYGDPSPNKSLEDVYEMLKYLCEYNPDAVGSTTYHNKLYANDTKTTVHDQLSYNNKYKYTINSYKNGASVQNGYTPALPVSITVTDYQDTFQSVKGYPDRQRFYFKSSGADGERYIDMFYSTKNKRWYVYGETWKYLLMSVRDPIIPWVLADDPTVPAGRKMEKPTLKMGEKVLKNLTYIDGKTGEKKTEDVHLKKYTYTFKTVPQTLGELKQFDLSDPETGGYLLTCLAILIYDIYVPQNGELQSTPSKNKNLEEVYKMLKYLCEYDPDSSASTTYHNRLDPNPTKQFIHDRLAYYDRYKYTINSYKNGATPENDYTPTQPVSITVTEYVYELAEGSVGYPKLQRFIFNSSGADSDRFLDAFYDSVNKRWFVYSNTWKFLLEAVRDPVPTEF